MLENIAGYCKINSKNKKDFSLHLFKKTRFGEGKVAKTQA